MLLVPALMLTGCIDTFTAQERVQTFDIRPYAITHSVERDGIFTVLVLVNDTVLETWRDPEIAFSVIAQGSPGDTTENFAFLYFSVTEFEQEIFKYNGANQIIWEEQTDMWYENGYKKLSYLKMYNFTLTFDFDMYELLQRSDSSLNVNFRNKAGTWEETFPVKVILVDINDT